jgi:hypothetical protein
LVAFTRNNGSVNETTHQPAAIIAVPVDALDELEREGLTDPLPILRGAAVDALVAVGMDAAALVTLLQTPDSVRAFAVWIRGRCARPGDSIELTARRGDRWVHLTIDGDIDIGIVADFLRAAFADRDPGVKAPTNTQVRLDRVRSPSASVGTLHS